jgi:hypothetical protein
MEHIPMKNNTSPSELTCMSRSSFMRPAFRPETGWTGHAPFAFWLVEILRPDSIVELGTFYGYSYFCFCQQVAALKLPTRCIAVDTWIGDEHGGFYGEKVFNTVKQINDANYSSFSSLLRSTFDDALDDFPDGSIDLLHIDGRHRYEDVKREFELWRPKLSTRSIVLFHDTQVRTGDFGVYRFWPEVSGAFPHFEFIHDYGLGVLGVGGELSPALSSLFEASHNDERAEAIRNLYQRLAVGLAGKPISRNESCPCGSGKRFKHCCGLYPA